MSELPIEGTYDRPVSMDPWHRIVEVHWASGVFALVTVTRANTNGFANLRSTKPPLSDMDGEVGVDWNNDPHDLPGINLAFDTPLTYKQLNDYRLWMSNRTGAGEIIADIFLEPPFSQNFQWYEAYSVVDQFLANFTFPAGSLPTGVEECSVSLSSAYTGPEAHTDLWSFTNTVRVRVYKGGTYSLTEQEMTFTDLVLDPPGPDTYHFVERVVGGYGELKNAGGKLLWEDSRTFDWKTTGELCRFNREGFLD